MKRFSEDSQERKLQAVPASDFICSYELSAGAARKAVPIPEDAAVMLVSSPVDVYLKFGDGNVTAIIPAGDKTEGEASEVAFANAKIAFNVLPGASNVSLIAAEATKVTVAWYAA